MDTETLINQAWDDRALLAQPAHAEAVERAIAMLDQGELRAARPADIGPDGHPGRWETVAWAKRAVLLYFQLRGMESAEAGPFEYHDKIPLKRGYAAQGVRAVPGAIARRGAHIAPGAVLMPSYVNIGAHVGAGTMVDTWATVGSCAQIGAGVHLSGGVGIGGVLEPVAATPVVVEDHCFIGSRCIVVEGARVRHDAVLGAGVVLTGSTRVVDVTGSQPQELRGEVPPYSVVIPGSTPKQFPAGTYHVPCALIIGRRTASTDKKTSLNHALRDFNVTA